MKGSGRLPADARAILRGDRRVLARVITAVENGDPHIVPTVRALYPRTGRAHVIGVTGPLGVGKSSLISALLSLLRSRGVTVGIIAVDPSSPFSGGSVLGDRIRIDRRPGDAGIFFRSMASRGHAGGVAAPTRDVTRLLDAAGFDIVLVETVGSGQVDLEIRSIATTSIVVLVPHLGDEVQTMKAGLFEIADVFCVNKADLAGAETAAKDLAELVALGGNRDGWAPPIVMTSAPDSRGIQELWTAVEAHERFLDARGLRVEGERRRVAQEVLGLVQSRLGAEFGANLDRDPKLSRLLDRVVGRSLDPHAAADLLLDKRGRAIRPSK